MNFVLALHLHLELLRFLKLRSNTMYRSISLVRFGLFASLIASISTLLPSRLLLAQELPSCFMVSDKGKFLNLDSVRILKDYICTNRNKHKFDLYALNPFAPQFVTALKSLGVSVSIPGNKSVCSREEVILMGFYSNTKSMVICEVALKDPDQFFSTLVHESWHTVQHCIGGFKKNDDFVSLSEDDPDFLQTVLEGSSSKNLKDIRALYPDEEKVAEAEARYMETRPSFVLKALKLCRKYL
jgi:hypothetical protein